MIRDHSPIFQSFLGTVFTWGLTAAGAALVFCFSSTQRKLLDGSLGFAAGVMMAASYWSLLKPAIEIATESGGYGSEGEYVFIPVAIGFFLGAVFVFLTDLYLPCCENVAKTTLSPDVYQELGKNGIRICDKKDYEYKTHDNLLLNNYGNRLHRRYKPSNGDSDSEVEQNSPNLLDVRWRRILLLIIAITVHNIPEGLAVGVGFGAVGKTKSSTFESARNLAIGIGIQNFPEGLAVSLPLHAAGMKKWRSFWFGQLSGLVEPIFGLIGCIAVTIAEPILPYALAFAAGAMIYVVIEDIIPESRAHSNGKLASWFAIVGFIVMMSLDVGFG
ncbi:zinc transporter ZIP11-like [Argiope bruennichi]|uniref:Zinc transporter ZIP11 n=1 Tax=Argiope bruennichi TaxID=94029 RepID=A0A8T0EHI5_ARGBR|nr:zinc transporter ZIP11-like [Argiope bruennichi]KAF8773473.1 Zinc transporter ZIP11 like protein [Argiope bruennichi]